jgi:hypothetical protein
MEDRILPYAGNARGGGTHFPERAKFDKKKNYSKVIEIIEEGLNNDDPTEGVTLDIPPVCVNSLEITCECGCPEFTVLAYKCCSCGKRYQK